MANSFFLCQTALNKPTFWTLALKMSTWLPYCCLFLNRFQESRSQAWRRQSVGHVFVIHIVIHDGQTQLFGLLRNNQTLQLVLLTERIFLN